MHSALTRQHGCRKHTHGDSSRQSNTCHKYTTRHTWAPLLTRLCVVCCRPAGYMLHSTVHQMAQQAAYEAETIAFSFNSKRSQQYCILAHCAAP
jgi:hypothetical protein